MVSAHQFDAHDLHPQLRQDHPGHVDGRPAAERPDDLRLRRADGGRASCAAEDVDLIDQFYAVAQHQVGKMTDRAGRMEYENNTCPGCGSCSGMFTANSMNCLCEAIGMALPGNGTCLATSPARMELFDRAARRIVRDGHGVGRAAACTNDYPLLPRNIMTAARPSRTP